MTKKQKRLIVDIASVAVAIAGGLLAMANEITSIKGIPGELSDKWPLVLVLSTIINRIGQAVITKLEGK